LEFGAGESPALRNPACDQVLYVLEGAGTITIDGEIFGIEPEMGVYIRPGQTFSVMNPSHERIVLISSQCPEPESGAEVIVAGAGAARESALADAGEPGDKARSGSTGAGKSDFAGGEQGVRAKLGPQGFGASNSAPVIARATAQSSDDKTAPLVRLADRKALPTGDRWYRVLVDDEVGSTQVTQFIGSIPPGRAPDHFHLYEEVLFILRGEGRMWAGKTSSPVGAGSCVYLPKGQSHCVENTGAGELRLLGVFYPAGSPAVRYDAD
jgi:mannose-6-phosphate isomerase-like protein (cupin superfamily)